jgi:hypothetical protein
MAKAKAVIDEMPGAPLVDEAPPPPFGTGKPAAADGVLPRVVGELERAVPGTVRFKVGCRNYSPRKTRYVLAKPDDEAGARACYLKAEGLDKELERARKAAGANAADVEDAELVVTRLAD